MRIARLDDEFSFGLDDRYIDGIARNYHCQRRFVGVGLQSGKKFNYVSRLALQFDRNALRIVIYETGQFQRPCDSADGRPETNALNLPGYRYSSSLNQNSAYVLSIVPDTPAPARGSLKSIIIRPRKKDNQPSYNSTFGAKR